MTQETLVGSVKEKVGMVAAHGKDVVKTGVETLQAAKGVVDGSRRDARLLLGRTRDELRKTLLDGVDRIRHKLANIATPTHKELADGHKAEIKAKKRSKRQAQAKTANGGATTDGSGATAH